MSITRPRSVTRRRLSAGLATLIAWPALAARPVVVTILGDSITAGYGLPVSAALPAQLQLALARSGVSVVVRGAGVSGDTTAGGLARMNFSVQPDTTLCVVALGGNDLLQGLDPKATRANLDAIVRRLKARGVSVILTGIAAPPAIGRSYADEFNTAFTSVARSEHVALYPDLLAGVGADKALKQRDGIHPNAAGAALIARRLAPLVARALGKRS